MPILVCKSLTNKYGKGLMPVPHEGIVNRKGGNNCVPDVNKMSARS